MITDSEKIWIYLSCYLRISRSKLCALYKQYGSAHNITDASKDELTHLLNADTAEKIKNYKPSYTDKFISLLEKTETNVMGIESEKFPDKLRKIKNFPVLLYYKGKYIDMNKYLCLSSIGTRTPTMYGKEMTYRIINEAAKKGIVIVSGLAQGIDAISHKAAIDSRMPTVAFVANGCDVIYPKCNTDLYLKILKTGMIVSEYPPLTQATKYSFIDRNRLISGSSEGVFLSEAKTKSGSSSTVKFAKEENKDIFPLVHSADSVEGSLPIELIKSGFVAVSCGDDIVNFYKEKFKDKIKSGFDDFLSEQKGNKAPLESFEALSDDLTDEEKVISILRKYNLDIDALSDISKIELNELDILLLNMEISGKIKNDGGIYSLSD